MKINDMASNKMLCTNCMKKLDGKQNQSSNNQDGPRKNSYTLLDSILESSTVSSLLFNENMYDILKHNTDNPDITTNI